MSASLKPASLNMPRLASAEGAKAKTSCRSFDGLDRFLHQRGFTDAGRTPEQDHAVAGSTEYARPPCFCSSLSQSRLKLSPFAGKRIARPSPLAGEFDHLAFLVEHAAGRGHPPAVALADNQIASGRFAHVPPRLWPGPPNA